MISVSKKVLVVEDDSAHAALIEETLRTIGLVPTRTASGRQACEMLANEAFTLVVVDVGLPDMNGLDVQSWLSSRPEAPPVVFVTADCEVDHAVSAMRRGALHYIVKKRNYLRELDSCVRGIINEPGRSHEVRAEIDSELVGSSRAIEDVRRKLLEFARAEGPVLIVGETGTGKDLVARMLHRLRSTHERPFIAVNCATSVNECASYFQPQGGEGVPWIVSTARGGTLLLDEVGEMPLPLQPLLLRVLDAGDAGSARILATTKHDLERKVALGELRVDLYHRLNGLRLSLPPLRSRRGDIGPLVRHFARRHLAGGLGASFSREAMSQLGGCEWPGNVRELERVVQRTLAGWTGGRVFRFDLGPMLSGRFADEDIGAREELVALVRHYKGRLAPVAGVLGISKRTLQRRLAHLEISVRDVARISEPQP